MQKQSYGDKQREAQQRKKQEELLKKANPEPAPKAETPKADADKKSQPSGKPKRKKDPPNRPPA